MADREKLIELIKHIVIPYFAEQIADHLIANGVTVQRWIPVTERLPEDEVEVLIATDCGGQFIGIYDSKRKEWKDWSDEYREHYSLCGWMGDVTHWMPLPEVPGEET